MLRHGGVTDIHVACVAIVESTTFLLTKFEKRIK